MKFFKGENPVLGAATLFWLHWYSIVLNFDFNKTKFKKKSYGFRIKLQFDINDFVFFSLKFVNFEYLSDYFRDSRPSQGKEAPAKL